MRKHYLLGLLILLALGICLGISRPAQAKVEAPDDCQKCGMNRTAFAESRTVVIYLDGTTVGNCSIYCAAAELRRHKDKPVKSLLVADYNSKALIDARTASWVVGGKERGVMSAVAKWAFAKEGDAQQFVQEKGGKIASFEQVLQASTAEVAADEGGN
jgi:copper chaperone NosL